MYARTQLAGFSKENKHESTQKTPLFWALNLWATAGRIAWVGPETKEHCTRSDLKPTQVYCPELLHVHVQNLQFSEGFGTEHAKHVVTSGLAKH